MSTDNVMTGRASVPGWWDDEQDVETAIEHSISEGDFETMKKFIQLNQTYISVDRIVSVERMPEKPAEQEKLVVLTSAIECGIEGMTSSSATYTFLVESKEGQALLHWLEGETEVLVSYEQPEIQPEPVAVSPVNDTYQDLF
jgi:hypothetical protein